MNSSMLLCDFEGPKYLFFSDMIPPLVYYSHLPIALISFMLGFFILTKGIKKLPNWILFIITSAFSLWVFLDSIFWATNRSDVIMFVWSLQILVEPLIYIFCLYLLFVLTNKRDAILAMKFIIVVLYLPIVIFLPTIYNLSGFDRASCLSIEGPMAIYYTYSVEIVFALWLIAFSFKKYRIIKDSQARKEMLYLTIGMVLLLFSFSSGNIVSSFSDDWNYAQIGLFAMPFFISFLVYNIVKYKTFHIKLLGAQALIVAQIILIAAMFTFSASTINRILISITFVGTTVMGWFMIRSTKKLDERKEELQKMAEKLSQANDQLRVLDNSKTEFISIASHQLRTPLTAVKGFVSMLLEGSYGELKPQQEDILNKVYTSNERLVNLVEDLLNVSRMESGRMEFKFAPWNMERICKDVIDTFMLRAKDHKLSLECDMPKQELPEVMIDGMKVREVISNLVDNALKYTPDGHGGVKLKSELLGENIRVTISDTGIGIPQTELPYLFAKFSRGKDVGRLNTGGTGLGLYVGKSMIENNGGRIWAESDGQDLGSRFIIEIPIQQSEELLKKWA